MSKVFEALQRQQQNDQNNDQGADATRDPLAAETGASAELADNGEAQFELPSVIGAPVGPRTNEGALFSSLDPSFDSAATNGATTHSQLAHPAQPETNGKAASQVASHNASPINGKPANHVSAKTVSANPAAESPRPVSTTARELSEKFRAERVRKEKSQSVSPVIRRTEPEPKSESTPPEVPNPVSETPAIRDSQPISTNQARRQREIPVEPIVQSRLHPRLIVLTEPQAPECEQYRTLRTQVFHAAEKKPLKVITVTSTLAGEGKTSTVINLALSIAQSKEKRVLVIDGDLRRPNIATYLGVKAKVGLGETLAGDVEPFDSLFTLEGYELYILPVSREALNPTELLSSERFAEMVTELREYFDFILIDSPPVIPFADARLLANHTDAVMLVVRAGMAPYETVEKAIEALPAGKMLGVVLNGAEHEKESGYYDYYYYPQREDRPQSFWQKLLRPFRNSRIGRKWKR